MRTDILADRQSPRRRQWRRQVSRKSHVSFQVDGEALTHAGESPAPSYATLCGEAGADDGYEEVEAAKKINCPRCFAIWQAAKKYRASDFDVGGNAK